MKESQATTESVWFVVWIVIFGLVLLFVLVFYSIPPEPKFVFYRIPQEQKMAAIPDIMATELAHAYKENTVDVDHYFKGKKFKVSGTVSDIRTDFMGVPYLELRGGVNKLMEPQFSFEKSDANQLAQLKKGSQVTLICEGKGVVATIPMSGSCTIAAPSQKVEAPPKAIGETFSKDDNADLISILSNRTAHCPRTGTCEIKEFTLEPIDVNADGKHEFIVTHDGYCGSGGCTTVLMAKASDNSWAPLAGIFGGIRIMATSTNGYRDIQLSERLYPTSEPWNNRDQKFSWSGHKYVANGRPERQL